MGIYINIGNAGFQSARNGEYVDKSGLIAVMNGTLFTERFQLHLALPTLRQVDGRQDAVCLL